MLDVSDQDRDPEKFPPRTREAVERLAALTNSGALEALLARGPSGGHFTRLDVEQIIRTLLRTDTGTVCAGLVINGMLVV